MGKTPYAVWLIIRRLVIGHMVFMKLNCNGKFFRNRKDRAAHQLSMVLWAILIITGIVFFLLPVQEKQLAKIFNNISFELDGQTITLHNGYWRNGLEEYHVVKSHGAFGDIGQNGKKDAIVLLVYSGGGTGTFFAVVIRDVVNQKTYLDGLGDRIIVKKIFYDQMRKSFIVRFLDRMPDQPMATTPAMLKIRSYRLVDGVLQAMDIGT